MYEYVHRVPVDVANARVVAYSKNPCTSSVIGRGSPPSYTATRSGANTPLTAYLPLCAGRYALSCIFF